MVIKQEKGDFNEKKRELNDYIRKMQNNAFDYRNMIKSDKNKNNTVNQNKEQQEMYDKLQFFKNLNKVMK